MDNQLRTFLKNLGVRLHEARITRGYDAKFVSGKLRLTVERLYQIEEGEVDIDVLLLFDFCELYRVSAGDLFE